MRKGCFSTSKQFDLVDNSLVKNWVVVVVVVVVVAGGGGGVARVVFAGDERRGVTLGDGCDDA